MLCVHLLSNTDTAIVSLKGPRREILPGESITKQLDTEMLHLFDYIRIQIRQTEV